MSKLPINCPSCDHILKVTGLTCSACNTQVLGNYQVPVLSLLAPDEQEFVLQFLLNSGSLKEMATQMGKSYPTVRNKLDDLIARIKELESSNTTKDKQ